MINWLSKQMDLLFIEKINKKEDWNLGISVFFYKWFLYSYPYIIMEMRKEEPAMKMLAINPISFKKRMIEFLFDYLFILTYLVFLFIVSMLIYIIFFNGVPEFTEIQSQWLVFFTSILPIALLFIYLDYAKNGSLGKTKAGLELVYQKKTVQASLIRNTIKFLPWQIGHMGTIHGFYSNFDGLSISLSISATLLAVLLLVMTLFRKDKRHIGDLLAHTQVQLKGE